MKGGREIFYTSCKEEQEGEFFWEKKVNEAKGCFHLIGNYFGNQNNQQNARLLRFHIHAGRKKIYMKDADWKISQLIPNHHFLCWYT